MVGGWTCAGTGNPAREGSPDIHIRNCPKCELTPTILQGNVAATIRRLLAMWPMSLPFRRGPITQ